MPDPLSHLLLLAACGAGGSGRFVARLPLRPLLPLLLLLALQAARCSCASASRDRIVYWNASNPLFQQSGENVLVVSLQDRINFICPDNGVEYYQIYWTPNQDQMKACSGGSILFSCRRMESYLVYVQIFPADPTAPGFLNPVYFYTPSTGDLAGLEQTSGGACLARNMRVTVRTGDPAATTPLTAAAAAGTTPAPASSSATRQPQQPPQTNAGPSQQVTADTSAKMTSDAPAMHQTLSSSSTGSAQTPTRPQTTPNTGRVPERLDSTRTLNLITGASVARATVATVTSLTCITALIMLSGCCLW